MVISALIFPGVMIYIVYAFFVPLIMDMPTRKAKDSVVYAINPPPVIQSILEHTGITLTLISENEKESVLEGIAERSGNFLIVFPQDFIEKVVVYDVRSGEVAPEILLYYNSLSGSFAEHYGRILTALAAYESSIAKKFDVNRTAGGDMADTGAVGRHLIAIVLPVFLLVFIFHGAMAVTTEAITGEKERGTFATIFITSLTPIELAAGKIFGLSIQSFLCGISGTLGIALSLPKLVDSLASGFPMQDGMSALLNLNTISMNQYSVVDFCILALVLLSTACIIVTIISIIAIYARTAKEAQLLVSPMIIVFLFISCLNMFYNQGNQIAIYYYFIPIYNSAQSMSDIFNQSYALNQIIATITTNIFAGAIGCFVLSRLLKTEKMLITS
ncbi:MAG: ABC transporter permease [Spirochaetaceae bacterium]|nr:ABC transporter permease [Spirochaetaceae bacterium]